MKKLLFLLFIITVIPTTESLGQAVPNNKYYYSQVTIHYGGYNKHKSSEISFGTDYSIEVEKEAEIKSKIQSFKDPVDIINYLEDLGWQYVDNQNMLFNDMVIIYTFRKIR